MAEVQIARDLVTMLLMMASTLVWPPVLTGPFWLMAGLYGLVSILFDDETPRGIPGIDSIRMPLNTGVGAQSLAKGPGKVR